MVFQVYKGLAVSMQVEAAFLCPENYFKNKLKNIWLVNIKVFIFTPTKKATQ